MPDPDQNASAKPSNGSAPIFTWMASVVALVSFVSVVVGLFIPIQLSSAWFEAVLLLALTVMTLSSMLRQLPPQNVFFAAAIIAVIGSTVHGVSAATAIPFGPLIFTDAAGFQLFRRVPWEIPFIWIVAVLNSRGVARLILRPWRKLRARYGFWVIGLSTALAVIFNAMLEPYASRVRHYWLWEETKIPFTWYGAPVTDFVGWAAASVIILAFVTPLLIKKRKKSRDKSILDYYPLVIWILLDALFAAGAATQQLWSAVILCAVSGVVVMIAAIRGSRW